MVFPAHGPVAVHGDCLRTPDLGGTATTGEFTDKLLELL